jgi:hypothetical protein
MFKLGILLIGSAPFRKQWYFLVALGALFVVLGVGLVLGHVTGLDKVVLALFGVPLVIQGASGLMSSNSVDRGLAHWRFPIITLLLGLILIGSVASGKERLVTVFLASILFLDGATRMAPAVLARYPTWQYNLARSIIEISLAIMLAANWPLPADRAIATTVAIALSLSGWGLVRLGCLLREHDEEVALLLLPVFGARGWYDHAPVLAYPSSHEPTALRRLTLYVWLPESAAAQKQNLTIIGKYIAAKRGDGSTAVGHVALELPSGEYLSHYRSIASTTLTEKPLKAIAPVQENDALGIFRQSYAEESTLWGDAHAQISIENFNERRLMAFWTGYKQDTTYNLLNRNCSTLTAAALDAAIEGAIACPHPWRLLARLYLTSDFWQASFVRNRAEAGTWTPGLIHDYAAPLARLLNRYKP